ncbi:MAG: DUF721 domain-containing protein [Actinomycetota bacterium]
MGDRAGPTRLADLLNGAGRRLGLGHAVSTGRLWTRWEEVVGAPLAQHAEPSSLRDGVLRVRVDSPAWATEVGYLGEAIKERANAALGRPLVTEVRVWTGPRRRRDEGVATPSAERKPLPLRAAPRDAAEAFERARRAWVQRRSSGP